MSGGNRSTQTTNTNQTSSGTSTSSTPGTAWGQNVLSTVDGANIAGQVQQAGSQGFQGDRVATMPDPSNGFVAQWGQQPSTFVPQLTTTAAPTQVQQTHVDPNYNPGIAEGLATAGAQSGQLADISQQGLANWQTILQGPENPYMADVLSSLQAEHELATNRNQQSSAAVWGQQGAFGGGDMAKADAFRVGEETRNYDATVANLLYGNYNNWTNLLAQSPTAIAGMAGIGDITANRLLNYGGLQQENEAAAAATADENAQRDANNAWQTGTLADTNAERAAADALAAWEAAYQVDTAATAEGVAQAEHQQSNTQAGIDNEYARWASERDALSTQIEQLAALLGLSSAVPGGTVSTEQTGQGTSTTQTRTSTDPLQVLGGLLGAGLQFFAPGAGAATSIPRFGTSPSERRLKSGIKDLFVDDRGIRWYQFHYKNDPNKAVHTGVMADEIHRLVPEAIEVINGVHHVNYDTLAEWRR